MDQKGNHNRPIVYLDRPGVGPWLRDFASEFRDPTYATEMGRFGEGMVALGSVIAGLVTATSEQQANSPDNLLLGIGIGGGGLLLLALRRTVLAARGANIEKWRRRDEIDKAEMNGYEIRF